MFGDESTWDESEIPCTKSYGTVPMAACLRPLSFCIRSATASSP